MLKLLWWEFESKEELKKFAFLAVVFFGIILVYWTLRPLKDSIFDTMIGLKKWQWLAKALSLVVVSALVMVYGKLIDAFSRHKVFYIFIILYTLASLFFYYRFSDPVYGLANTVRDPSRYLGWIWYVFVESFGSLVVALFWAIVTDITAPESAKRGFPLIALFGQFGNMIGPLCLDAKKLGFSSTLPILLILAAILVCIGLTFLTFMHITPQSQLKGYHEEGEEEGEPGFFEGLKLLLTNGYLFGMFLMVTFYELIVTCFDYYFKQAAATVYTTNVALTSYLNWYGFLTGLVSTACVLFGINRIQRVFGVKISLFMTPIFVGIAVVILKLNPDVLSVALAVIVCSKAVNYSLNQPTFKQLYIPTTKETKYKAQAWLEMFGSRGSKGSAGFITSQYEGIEARLGAAAGTAQFLWIMMGVTFGCIAIWIPVAAYVAKIYDNAIKEKKNVC